MRCWAPDALGLFNLPERVGESNQTGHRSSGVRPYHLPSAEQERISVRARGRSKCESPGRRC